MKINVEKMLKQAEKDRIKAIQDKDAREDGAMQEIERFNEESYSDVFLYGYYTGKSTALEEHVTDLLAIKHHLLKKVIEAMKEDIRIYEASDYTRFDSAVLNVLTHYSSQLEASLSEEEDDE